MPLLHQTRTRHPTNALSPEQIRQILARLDENLWQDPIYRNPVRIAPHPVIEGSELSAVTSELRRRLKKLHSMQAPLFVVKGRDFSNQVKWLLNLPLRLFGSKQIRFNNELLEMLELIVAQSYLIDTLTEEVKSLQHAATQLEEHLVKQTDMILHLSQQHGRPLDTTHQPPLEAEEDVEPTPTDLKHSSTDANLST
jgi:hypothetical protein